MARTHENDILKHKETIFELIDAPLRVYFKGLPNGLQCRYAAQDSKNIYLTLRASQKSPLINHLTFYKLGKINTSRIYYIPINLVSSITILKNHKLAPLDLDAYKLCEYTPNDTNAIYYIVERDTNNIVYTGLNPDIAKNNLLKLIREYRRSKQSAISNV